MTVYPIQANFSRGELSPKLHARVDIEFYKAALKTCTNWTVMKQGGLRKRPGFRFVREAKDSSTRVRLIPFVFSTEQAYVLEFGDSYIRHYANGGIILSGGSPVETTTPYSAGEVLQIDYAQTADVLTLVQKGNAPRELTRTSDTAWTMTSITFKDGPYLDEPINNTNGAQPDIRSVISDSATFTTTPAVSSGAIANIFDADNSTNAVVNNDDWIVEIDFTGSRVCDNYAVQSYKGESQPTAWTIEGWDGSAWVTLDTRSGQVGVSGERRFYTFQNVRSFGKYRMVMTTNAGRESTSPSGVPLYGIVELVMGYNGDYAPTMTLTFDNLTNVNDGTGFQTTDVGRHIRLYGTDGKWRWFLITGRTSTTVVTGRLYGYALPNTSKIYRWQLGAWKSGQWPQKVSFYESRRTFARSDKEPHVVWLSKTFDFYDMGTSQPLVDDDGIRLRIVSNEVNAITFLAEVERLAIGTTGAVRVLGKANTQAGFGATNFDLLPNAFVKAKAVNPVRCGSALLFADYFGKSLRELVYDLNTDGYIAPDLTILSEHLLRAGITEMAYQETPDSIVWIVTAGGGLVAMTYDREQKIVALTDIEVAEGDPGTGAKVESVCTIPGADRDEVWISVRRTINGVTKRYIETLTDEFEDQNLVDGVFLDSSLTYDGAATDTVTGLNHLANMTVYALADGIVYRNLTVSGGGSLTLPAAASVIHVGLPYTATGTTLALDQAGQQNGSGLGRRKQVQTAGVSVLRSLGLKVKGLTADQGYDVFTRESTDPAGAAMNVRTGTFNLNFDSSWRDDGSFTFYSDDPLPCTVRGFIFGVTGEP